MLQPEPLKRSTGSYYSSLVQACRRIVAEESYRGLWKGHVPAQFLSAVYGLAQFTTFEFLTKQVHEKTSSVPTSAVHFLCGSVSGGVATVCGQPFDTLRTRLVGQGEPKLYIGLTQAFRSMVKREGFTSLYKGLIPALTQVVPYTGIQFALYNLSSRLYDAVARTLGFSVPKENYAAKEFLCGSGSGLVAKLIVYPFDLVKKRLQVQGFENARLKFGRAPKYTGLLDCIGKIGKEEGVRGLYKGIAPSLIKASISSGLTFTIYEETVRFIGFVRGS